ncbi:hypothetical protein B0O80DRAFT_452430 [Mortierella sp. GBAus27b]|nr:hypothetical protein B0O80DRAFT_452430 [Mortierella sp. GBAus27b]
MFLRSSTCSDSGSLLQELLFLLYPALSVPMLSIRLLRNSRIYQGDVSRRSLPTTPKVLTAFLNRWRTTKHWKEQIYANWRHS